MSSAHTATIKSCFILSTQPPNARIQTVWIYAACRGTKFCRSDKTLITMGMSHEKDCCCDRYPPHVPATRRLVSPDLNTFYKGYQGSPISLFPFFFVRICAATHTRFAAPSMVLKGNIWRTACNIFQPKLWIFKFSSTTLIPNLLPDDIKSCVVSLSCSSF